MGQAKLRGSKEERIRQGIEKEALAKKLAKEREEERERNMTDEERAKRKKAGLLLAVTYGLIG